jgi:hypothetical protein
MAAGLVPTLSCFAEVGPRLGRVVRPRGKRVHPVVAKATFLYPYKYGRE